LRDEAPGVLFGDDDHGDSVLDSRAATIWKLWTPTEIVRELDPDLEIDGERQADTAVFEGLLKESYPWSRLKEPANVLIFPELQSANIAYKLIWRLANAEAVGPVLLGLGKPVHVLQGGLEVSDIVNMAALCVVDAQELERGRPESEKS